MAGKLVSAAIAAYFPPPASIPQMDIAMRRVPTSRAALVATGREYVNCCSNFPVWGRVHTSDGGVTPDTGTAIDKGQRRNSVAAVKHALGEGDDHGSCNRGRAEVGGVEVGPNDKTDEEVL